MKKILKHLGLLAFVFVVLIGFSGCLFTLSAPTLTMNGYIIEWENQSNASKYEVILNEDKIITEQNSIDVAQYIKDSGTYTVKVKAFSKSLFYNDSEYSSDFTFTVGDTPLSAPTNLTLSTENRKYIASWQGVSGASFYLLKLENSVNSSVIYIKSTTTTSNFTDKITQGGQYTLSVSAFAENLEEFKPSAYSDAINFEKAGYLQSPTNLKVVGDVLSWKSVDGASKYIVATTEGKTLETTNNTINLTTSGLLSVGNITPLFVQAISGNSYNYDSPYSNGVTYLRNTSKVNMQTTNLEYMNTAFDLCADSVAELKSLLFYVLYYRIEDINFYISYLGTNINVISNEIYDQMDLYDEIKSISYQVSILGDLITLKTTFKHPNTPSIAASGNVDVTQDTSVKPLSYAGEYEKRADDFDDFLINTRAKSLVVFNSDQLYVALQNGYKPVFTSTNSPARAVYEQGKEILKDIVATDMTELQKLNAIYDWLSYTVKYDYNLLNLTEKLEGSEGTGAQSELSKYDGFYIEGVLFDDGQAVCDGISKTMVMLASIENITIYKVSGKAGGGNHAWNKVKLDLNDLVPGKEWYTMDVTWGDSGWHNSAKTKYTEYLAHTYYLVTDDMITNNQHQELSPKTDVSNTEFNYYQNTTLTYNTTTVDLYIENSTQLNNLLYVIEGLGITGLDFELGYNELLINTKLSAYNVNAEQVKSSTGAMRTIYVISAK